MNWLAISLSLKCASLAQWVQRLLPDHGSAVSYSPEARQVPPAPRPLGEPYPLLVGLYRVYRLVLKDPRHFGRTEHAVVRVEVVVVVLGTVRFARVVARQLPVHTVAAKGGVFRYVHIWTCNMYRQVTGRNMYRQGTACTLRPIISGWVLEVS